MDIDTLKIDRSFVRDLTTDPSDLAIAEAIIAMAHKLDINVVAEGIETDAQRQRLADAGCDFGQGYLFSPPLPEDAFFAYLAAQTR
jgi:EAL domain-containing protein (putative c-di-GMP-specific phosphodiesterase class I)